MWEPSSPAAKYGGSLLSNQPTSPVASELHVVHGASEESDVFPFHPDSPLFWFAVIAAAAVGLMYASTTVRVGPLQASVSAGKS